MPFYDAIVSYSLLVPPGTTALTFPRENWAGALIVAYSEGKEIGRTFESPWTIDVQDASTEEIEIQVVGLPINLFGPWHDPGHRWGVGVPAMWTGEHLPANPQPGSLYGHMDLGLLKPEAVYGLTQKRLDVGMQCEYRASLPV